MDDIKGLEDGKLDVYSLEQSIHVVPRAIPRPGFPCQSFNDTIDPLCHFVCAIAVQRADGRPGINT